MGEEKVHPYFKENKYGIFDWILSGLNVDLLDSLVPNRENQTTGSIFFIQAICFPFIPYNSNYYIFDSHSGYSFGQSSENVYWILLQFVTIEHVLNFVTTSYLIDNQLQYIYENQFVFCFSKRHYDGNVIIFKNGKYNHDFITKINTNVSSFDYKFYIFKTSNASAKRKNVPSQAMVNGFQLEKFNCLNTLELILIAKGLLFNKVVVMPKGQTPKNSWYYSKCACQCQ